MIKGVWRQIRSTAKIDPARHSPITSPDRLHSFAYALSGCLYMLRRQKNTRIQLLASSAVVAAGLWLDIDAGDWAILILTMGGVWVAEFINAAIEATVNLQVNELHPMAKVAKDVAAAAVLIAAVVALLVGALMLGPPLAAKLLASAASN
ncbi:MAG: diacylglycerol kinase family protein [Chloroflexota bacterium]|nr:diacylglycerol kinase family protein [Chloroflexota bacterium]MDE2946892.1 diacylglycerol kinase family protein [Chloroflexota bacterium]